jgi:carbon-monoxide dehydrogenase small subunit
MKYKIYTEERIWDVALHLIKIQVNDRDYAVEVKPHEMLLDLLRDRLNLKGTKKSCEGGQCGACVVFLNGRTVNSCLVLAAECDKADILTIEGLIGDNGPEMHPLQKAFIDEGAIQCGYCTPGMIIAAKGLLDRNPAPSEQEVKEALVGNLCRCTGYLRIVNAVLSASKELQEIRDV